MTKEEKEAKIKELQQKIKELEDIKIEPVYRSWEDLEKEDYEFVQYSVTGKNPRNYTVNSIHVHMISPKIVKKTVATGKLALLMKLPEYNGDWEPNYSDLHEIKYIICRIETQIKVKIALYFHEFLSFKTEEIRDAFLKKNIELIKEYFELD